MPGSDDYFGPDHDPYLNKDTGILSNIPQLKSATELEDFEKIIFQGSFPDATAYIADQKIIGLGEWQEIHHICFGDVYEWAGSLRTIRIAKNDTVFAYPENIEAEAARLFGQLNGAFGGKTLTIEIAAMLFAEINVLHPFREGNGRTQRILFSEIFSRIGYTVDYDKTSQDNMIAAMVDGYNGNYDAVIELFRNITDQN